MTRSADLPGHLRPATDQVAVRPLASPADLVAGLDPAGTCWGWYTTPTEARLLRAEADHWAEVAAQPNLQQLRVFALDRDLAWLVDRGVALSVVPPPGGESAPELIGGPGWLQRDRRSRLWGEHLEGTDTWYEERIPDPLLYEGLAPGAENRYAFLRYREYVRSGVVLYVRYIAVEGGAE
jgi:hypothetical protein